MKNITLVGRLKDYADKAADSFYKTAGRIASPIIDTVASIDFAGSYFNNSSIPEYTKFQALRRNIITDDSAIAQIGGEFPAPGKKMESGWKDFWKILAAAGVISAAGGGYAYMKKKDIGMDDIDSGIAYAKAKIFGSAFFGGAPPVAFDNVVPANATPQVSETPYKFSPDIQIFGSDSYKQKIQSALNEIKRTNITEYNEVMLYWETIDEKNVDGHGYLAEKDISPSNLIHDKEHIKQARVEPFKSYYANKSGWYMELDAVKKQVDWEAEAYNYTGNQKQQQIKNYMEYYKDRYPEQYAKWISEN